MIHCRQHLISWLLKNVTDRVLQNALESGGVENLGWFDPLPTSDAAGFLIRLTSVHSTTYIVAVAAGPCGKYRWFRVKEFSWADWGSDVPDELYQGDNAKVYKVLNQMSVKNETV